jgi:hypothetical protein
MSDLPFVCNILCTATIAVFLRRLLELIPIHWTVQSMGPTSVSAKENFNFTKKQKVNAISNI